MRRAALLAASVCLTLLPASALADGPRIVELQFTPTARSQIALWIERADGTFVQTLRLTEATALRGIGNRPGSSQMNSGFRWPYGRREGVLPVWSHRRAAAQGAFRRVIFQDRVSEGYASRTANDASQDAYFCLSFSVATTSREALDAVSCASVFNSDKGRYMTDGDVARGYGEPQQTPTAATFALGTTSPYPPRRDVTRCTDPCDDHADVAAYVDDAHAVMPDIDAVTMATPAGDTNVVVVLPIPDSWPDGDYVAWLEINVEGDYSDAWGPDEYPTPTQPMGAWDYWAQSYGYPYRGQPSVVYRVPFVVGGMGESSTFTPAGYGSLSGQGVEGGRLRPMDPSINDAPSLAAGSGADRLRYGEHPWRLRAVYLGGPTTPPPCTPEDPRPECAMPCTPGDPRPECAMPCTPGDPRPECAPACTDAMICACTMGNTPPARPAELTVEPYPDEKHSHQWARATFRVPSDDVGVSGYDVRVSTSPIVDDVSFERGVPAKTASLDSIAVQVPVGDAPGASVTFDLGGLDPSTHYYVGMRATDACGATGDLAVAEVTTSEIHFTVVSPCFVATAAYGSPMAREVGALRRLRDRHLMSNAPGRALVHAYYVVGSRAAPLLAAHETLRAGVRALLTPLVALARALE